MPTTLPPVDLLPVFNAQPGATLLLSPEWVIVGASDDYLAATLTPRAAIVGQFIFDAFPDNPEAPEANAVANVRASLAQVMDANQRADTARMFFSDFIGKYTKRWAMPAVMQDARRPVERRIAAAFGAPAGALDDAPAE